jgi:hypothetical protein
VVGIVEDGIRVVVEGISVDKLADTVTLCGWDSAKDSLVEMLDWKAGGWTAVVPRSWLAATVVLISVVGDKVVGAVELSMESLESFSDGM